MNRSRFWFLPNMVGLRTNCTVGGNLDLVCSFNVFTSHNTDPGFYFTS